MLGFPGNIWHWQGLSGCFIGLLNYVTLFKLAANSIIDLDKHTQPVPLVRGLGVGAGPTVNLILHLILNTLSLPIGSCIKGGLEKTNSTQESLS